jgi:hypothetical protein
MSAQKKRPKTFKLGPMEIELLRRVREECGITMAEALREAIRAYIPYLLEQCREKNGEGA